MAKVSGKPSPAAIAAINKNKAAKAGGNEKPSAGAEKPKSKLQKDTEAAKGNSKKEADKQAKLDAINKSRQEKADKAKAAAKAKTDAAAAKEQAKADAAAAKEKAKADKAAEKARLKQEAKDAKAKEKQQKALVPIFVDPEALKVALAQCDELRDSIRNRLKRTAEDIVAIGQDLNKAKDILPHGQFIPWVQNNFDMSHQSVINFMNVANKFAQDTVALNFSPTALYELAAAPAEVVEAVKAKAAAGEMVTVAEIKQMKAEGKPEKSAKPEKTTAPAGSAVKSEHAVDPGIYAGTKNDATAAPAQDDDSAEMTPAETVKTVFNSMSHSLGLLAQYQDVLESDEVAADPELGDMIGKMINAMRNWADALSPSPEPAEAPVNGKKDVVINIPVNAK